MPAPDCIAGTASALVAVAQVLTLAWYIRRWMRQRQTTWLVVLHYALTFGLLIGILYWSRARGQGPVAVAAGYGFGLVATLAVVLWNIQRAQAQQTRSEE